MYTIINLNICTAFPHALKHPFIAAVIPQTQDNRLFIASPEITCFAQAKPNPNFQFKVVPQPPAIVQKNVLPKPALRDFGSLACSDGQRFFSFPESEPPAMVDATGTHITNLPRLRFKHRVEAVDTNGSEVVAILKGEKTSTLVAIADLENGWDTTFFELTFPRAASAVSCLFRENFLFLVREEGPEKELVPYRLRFSMVEESAINWRKAGYKLAAE